MFVFVLQSNFSRTAASVTRMDHNNFVLSVPSTSPQSEEAAADDVSPHAEHQGALDKLREALAMSGDPQTGAEDGLAAIVVHDSYRKLPNPTATQVGLLSLFARCLLLCSASLLQDSLIGRNRCSAEQATVIESAQKVLYGLDQNGCWLNLLAMQCLHSMAFGRPVACIYWWTRRQRREYVNLMGVPGVLCTGGGHALHQRPG